MRTTLHTIPASLPDDGPRHGDALSAQAAALHGAGRAPISRHRVEAIRARIRSGGYDTPQVIDAVARRLLDSGEL